MEPIEAPPGALPQEVADDVDIKASSGEYVIPADVVRFMGLDAIERLVNKAKQKLAEMNQAGRIGGDTGEEAPAEEVVTEEVPPPMPMMAEGGLITTPAPTSNYSGVKQYQGANGQLVYIPFYQGQPLTEIPQGFTEYQPKPAQPATPTTTGVTSQPKESGMDRPTHELTGLAANPSEWNAETFIKYSQTKNSVDNKVAKGLVQTLIPMGKLAVGMREKYLKEQVPSLLDKMIETGKDTKGKTLTPEEITKLTAARADLSREPVRTNPIKGLMNKVGSVLSGGENKTSNSTSGGGYKASFTSNNDGDSTTYSDNSLKGKDGGLKKDTKSTGTKSGSFGPGMAKGGLVTKKKC